MESKTIAVVSSPQTVDVSCAIIQSFAWGSYTPILKCEDQASCEAASTSIRTILEARAEDGEISSDEAEAALRRVQITTDLGSLSQASVVIDAAFEDQKLKQTIISQLDEIASPEAILATHSPTISVTSLARFTRSPNRLIGTHFIYFSRVMKVVEIARGVYTSEETFASVQDLVRSVGMEPVVSEDAPGLLSTRIWMVHLNEAVNNVFNKLVEPWGLRKLNRTISPKALSILESADFIGLDNCLVKLQNLYEAYGDPKYAPSPLLVQMVDAGRLGIKTGKGFFNYK